MPPGQRNSIADARLAWRIVGGLALPPNRHRLLAAAMMLGVLNAWSHSEMIFNLFQLLAFGNRALRRLTDDWHASIANGGVHAAAAPSHRHVAGQSGAGADGASAFGRPTDGA
ncbi:MAG TPA: hypothetical protein VIZ17_00555 [Acetobacteraceae bacterium]